MLYGSSDGTYFDLTLIYKFIFARISFARIYDVGRINRHPLNLEAFLLGSKFKYQQNLISRYLGTKQKRRGECTGSKKMPPYMKLQRTDSILLAKCSVLNLKTSHLQYQSM